MVIVSCFLFKLEGHKIKKLDCPNLIPDLKEVLLSEVNAQMGGQSV